MRTTLRIAKPAVANSLKLAVADVIEGVSSSLVPSRASSSRPHPNARYFARTSVRNTHPSEAPQLASAQSKSKLTTQIPALAGAAKERVYLWRRRAATFATGTLTLVMAYGVIFGHNGLTAFAHKREEAKTLQVQAQQLQKENQRLLEHVNRLQNDPSAIEHEAREELHYTRAGEVIYTLPKADGDTDPSKPSTSKP